MEGADIHLKTNGGESALHFAAQSGSVELVTYLRKAGFDPSARNFFRDDAYEFARHSPNPEAVMAALEGVFEDEADLNT